MTINSEMVKALRQANGWSQEHLSEVCGLSLRTIQRIESTGNASLDSIRLLSIAFNIEPDTLIINESYAPQTPVDAVKKGLLEFANFSGTATRFEYWWFLVFTLIILAIATIMDERAYLVVAILLLLPFLAVGTRRLHDTGRSGWWQLFFLVPFGQIVVFILLAQQSNISSDKIKHASVSM